MEEFKKLISHNLMMLPRLLDCIQDLVFLMKQDGDSFRYVYINKAASEWLKTGTHVLDSRIEDVLPSNRAHSLIQKYKEAAQASEAVTFVEKLTVNDADFWGETQLTPFHSDTGEAYVLGIVRDVTEQKERELELAASKEALHEINMELKTLWKTSEQTERALRRSRQKYRIIMDHVFDSICIISTDGLIEYVSPSTEQLLGYPRERLMNEQAVSLIHPDDTQLILSPLAGLETGQPMQVEARILHCHGHYMWMDVSATPVIEDGALQQLIVIAHDITERKKTQKKLEKMAFFDYLSGLPNRRTFDDKLEKTIQKAQETGSKAAILMLDGRKFKEINDTFGHDAGDAVIKEMGSRLLSVTRASDTAARLGGDEMGLILPSIHSIEEATTVAERLIYELQQPFFFKDEPIVIGAGIGIACFPNHANDKKALVKCADQALYKAKERSTDAYCVYGEEPKEAGTF